MASNQIIKLVGALIVLLAIAWVSGAFESAPSTVDVPDLHVDTANIHRIEVVTPAHTVVVEHTGPLWQMTEPLAWPADSVAVRQFLREVGDLAFDRVVAISPDRYSRYGVDSTGYTIRFNDGSADYELVMSPNGPDYNTVYLRLGGDERVFSGSPRLSIPLSLSRWRDRSMIAIPAVAIEAATVITPEEMYVLSRDTDAGTWQVDRSGASAPADSASASQWINRFRQVAADGFVTASPDTISMTHTLEFRLVDGSTLHLDARREETRYLLLLDRTPETVYYVNKSRGDALFASASSLMPAEN